MVGIAKRKEYFRDSVKFMPEERPPIMVISDRLVPGIIERD